MKNKDFENSPFELYILYALLGLIFVSFIFSVLINPNNSVPDKMVDNNFVSTDDKHNNKSEEINSVIESEDKEFIPDLEKYEKIKMTKADISKGNLVLLNNDSKLEVDNFAKLVKLYPKKNDYYYVSSSDLYIEKDVIEPLNNMMEEFYNITQIMGINVSSAYRSYELQEELYKEEFQQKGNEAQYWVAKPGHSEHHSGLAIDFSIYNIYTGLTTQFDGTHNYSELIEIAPKHGFILRYKDNKKHITKIYYEPWHFRFTDLPHSVIITEKDFCFEEYIDFLKNYTLEKGPLEYKYDGNSYEIYYQEGLTVYVPKDTEYYISGNNVDGFIVTVKK